MPMGKPLPLSVISRAAETPLQRHSTRARVGLGVALDVGERLLGDAPHLPLLEDGEAGPPVAEELDLEAAALAAPGRCRPRGWPPCPGGRTRRCAGRRGCRGPRGSRERTSSRRCSSEGPTVVALAVVGHDPVELEGQVGQGLADAVVQVAGDPRALLVGADGAQPAEPAGVVDGQGDRLDEALAAARRRGW